MWIQNRESQSHDAYELQKLNAQNVLVTEASCTMQQQASSSAPGNIVGPRIQKEPDAAELQKLNAQNVLVTEAGCMMQQQACSSAPGNIVDPE